MEHVVLLVFTSPGGVVELERSLIVGRVRAGPKECEGRGKTAWKATRDG